MGGKSVLVECVDNYNKLILVYDIKERKVLNVSIGDVYYYRHYDSFFGYD